MRLAAAIIVLAGPCWAQFKSTVPLVVAPTTVTDSKGHFVDGLTADNLILYDDNVPQKIQMDWMTYPIDLVVAVQTSPIPGPSSTSSVAVAFCFRSCLQPTPEKPR
jgi:hypothetical protein